MTESSKIYDIKERTFQFSKDLILLLSNCKIERIHFSIFDQLIKSATSIGANIAEGKSGSSKNDFLKISYYSA